MRTINLLAYTLLLSMSTGLEYVLGQGLKGADSYNNLENASSSMFRSFDNRYKGVEGSTTVFEEFVKGEIKFKDGSQFNLYPLNYDAFQSQLVVDNKKLGQIMVVKNDVVESFTLINPKDGRELKFVQISKSDGFMELLWEGSIGLYKKHERDLEKANYGGGYNATKERRYDEFVVANKYLIKLEDGSIAEFKPQRRALEKIFEKKAHIFKAYIKTQKPDLKNDQELIQLFRAMEQK